VHWNAGLRACVLPKIDTESSTVCSAKVRTMREIPLPNGKVALVSDEDYPRASKLSWSDKGGGYVKARFKKSAGGDGYSFVLLHRFVTGAPAGMVVDHIDGNPLNNTRDNLQIVSQSQNCMRRRDLGDGVSMHRGKFRARARIHGKPLSLGVYSTRKEAADAVERTRAEAWAESDNIR